VQFGLDDNAIVARDNDFPVAADDFKNIIAIVGGKCFCKKFVCVFRYQALNDMPGGDGCRGRGLCAASCAV
jgi:hypothetical protein